MYYCSIFQQLQNLFQLYFGETPFKHFGKMRVETAAEFLRDEKLSIKEISQQCRFRSQLYFSTAFRKHFGESPSKFRKRLLFPAQCRTLDGRDPDL